MKTYLLNIPSKKTEEFNWSKPLNNYLLSVYGNTSEYENDLQSFEKLRQDIRGVNADLTGIKLYYKYYSQLELLDLRIPFGSINKHGRLSFTWFDAFETSKPYKQSALPYEKACTLFNLASLLSKYAIHKYEESSRSSTEIAVDDSSKESIQSFQQAAGIFEFLNENFLHAPSADLSQKSIRLLLKLMLAQSQEVFVLKIISSDTSLSKNSLVAKLCRSTANHYDECLKMLAHIKEFEEEDFGSDEYDDFDDADDKEEEDIARFSTSWLSVIRFKSEFYRSLSFYFNGLALEISKKIGSSIANITKSLNILEDISDSTLKNLARSGSGDSYELLENYKLQKDTVSIKLQDMEKENDYIYHEIIPSTTSIPDIKPLDSVKIVKINDNPIFSQINEQNYANFLNNIIPINIHELLSYYSEEKAQFLRNELDMVEVSNEELSSVLEYLQMPKALVSLKEAFYSNKDSQSAETEIDPILFTYAKEVQNGYNANDKNRNQMEDLKKRIYSIITECESKLSGLFIEDAFTLKEEIIKLKKALFEAGNSDTKLLGLMGDENSYFYNILKEGPQSSKFKQLFTIPTKSKNEEPEISLLDIDDNALKGPEDAIENTFKLLEDILHDLNTIKTNKAKLIDNLKSDIHKDDISDILILNSKIRPTNEIKTIIFPEELKKFDIYNHKLDEMNDKQKDLIKDLETNWNSLSGSSKVKEILLSSQYKSTLLKTQTEKLHKFHNDWKIYSDGVSKGVQFYTKLLEYAAAVRQKLFDSTPRPSVSLQDSFTQSFSNMSVSNSSSAPDTEVMEQGFLNNGSGPACYFGLSSNSTRTYLPQQGFFTPPVNGQFGTINRDQPPQLPPKRPSSDFHTGQVNSQAQQQVQMQPQSQNYNTQKQTNGKNNLIYDQPSTYQPNMYNFFSNNN